MGVLEAFKKNPSNLGNFVLITAHGTIEKAVEAIKEGAYDFLVKPVSLKHLGVTVNKALENSMLRFQNQQMREELQKKGMPDIIGKSRQITDIVELANKVAQNSSTVLITGSSGTGKELIARLLHYKSPRVGKPFVVVNCAAIPGNLLESQFFGYVRGAFTGAETDRQGLFHQANGGSLFLDEVGELDLNLQVKLFRALQEGEVRKVGSTETEKVDIRFITATNRNLLEEVKKGNFREDLYYRLNVVNIALPSLRDRVEDIPALVEYFIQKYNHILNKNIQSFGEDFIRTLSNYDFPGNIRELENIVQKAMILTDSPELTADLLIQKGGSFAHEENVSSLASTGLHDMVEAVEKDAIIRALKMFKANHSKVAKYLKIPRSTLYKKLHDYQIDSKKIL
jgi:two-component system response regulator AtoC